MRTVAEIRDRIAAHERQRAARASYVPRKRAGRPHTARTKRKLSALAFERFRTEALADPDSLHPLTLARLTHDPPLSAGALAERSLVAESLIRKIEAGHEPNALTWRRLARALGVRQARLHR
jgi:ribosome-binding protein aMBF1 (putative translation factor)